ncbi:Tumor suppressor candidate, putative isoform 1 [Hibiscus syriacus]|uniref:Tumor suppressor candidate, putative isoform 1 n=1 Tax=Hibiscus syriacus TaxID=106335 RepID=A0A6A3A927_HIBSY|nr:pentatricopeptide repeat-containing protein At4g21170-like [Hibiscus syriacus]KAE8700476.1 Tumor suppressor candidate, putative isoform 1 [Hibiscus syriacus]
MNFRCYSHRFIKPFSNLTPATNHPSSSNWRTQIKQAQLVSQVSSILLQRRNWAPLLQTLNLSSELTPALFLQILCKTQHHPQISLAFFNWVKTHLGFKPDLSSQCRIIRISLGSEFSPPVDQILDPLIQSHPAPVVADSMIQACKGKNFDPSALSSLIKCYSKKGLFMEVLVVFRKTTSCGFAPSICAYNELLDALQRGNEVKLAWCFLGAMIRGADPDSSSWSLVAQILCKSGKFDKVVRLIDKGIYNSEIYDLVVDFYSKTGDFEAAFHQLNEMKDRKLETSFCTYSSVLDGACKYDNRDVIERIMSMMIEKQLLPRRQVSGNDSIIQKLCDLKRTHAAEMMFKKACGNNIRLQDDTYGSLLKAMSQVGRIDEATNMYRMMLKRGIKVKESCYSAFLNILFQEDRFDDGYGLLVNIMKQGHNPCPSQLSKYITSQCRRNNWRKAEELLDVMLEKGLLPDSVPCCLVMEYYCFNREMDKVVALHNKMEKVKGSLDVTTYNMILKGLWGGRKAEEVARVFDYMIGLNLIDSASFIIMIRELSHSKELRKAMKIHDEMLKMGLKPDKRTYKRLISGFK